MFSPEIQKLLQKSLQTLPAMVGKRSLRHDIDDLVAMAAPGCKLAVVDDRDTAHAMGDEVFRALKGRFECQHITLRAPAADQDTVDELRRKTSGCDALIAVGSGTLSDLCKYTAFLDHKPYIVFPTAASMNGYLSANASITVDGIKKTLAAQMPLAVFCDLSVIAAAPVRLSKSGLGDSLARPTAQADWLLSHLLLNTPYDNTPFALLAPLEPQLFDCARGIAHRDPASIELLMQILLLSGLGMTIAHGSYPASQGEHMVAHAYGMLKSSEFGVRSSGRNTSPNSELRTPNSTLHGEEIGVTALAMSRLQEKLLRQPPALRSMGFDIDAMIKYFGKTATTEAKKNYHFKLENIEQAALRNDLLATKWDSVASRIESIMLPSTQIHAILKAAEAPATSESLGWTGENYEIAFGYARFLRDRFTFLDLCESALR